MKYFRYILSLVLISFSLEAQSEKCLYQQMLDETILEDIKYEHYPVDLDLEELLKYDEIDFLGFIGQNKKRLRVIFKSIIKSDLNCYLVEGNTTVLGENLRTFKGEFIVKKHFVFAENLYESMTKSGDKYGFSVLKYALSEDANLSSTGVFEGDIIILWRQDNNGRILYDNLFDGYDGSRNYQFFGIWQSYKTKKRTICVWGQHRIPCAGDLDIGAGEFSPNPKYFDYGWENYKP